MERLSSFPLIRQPAISVGSLNSLGSDVDCSGVIAAPHPMTELARARAADHTGMVASEVP